MYQYIIGNGLGDTSRSNAHTIDWDGNAWFQGNVYVSSISGTNKDRGSKILATQEYVDNAVSKDGKGLSTNDYTTIEKNKLAHIAEGAEVNVNADWNATEGDALILNKPTIPTVPTLISAFENDKGYLTEHQSLDKYAKTADIPNIILNMSDFIALQDKINELEERIAQLENPTTTE